MAKHKIPMYGGRWGNHENPLGPTHLQPSAMREPISSSAMSYITETISVIMNFCVTYRGYQIRALQRRSVSLRKTSPLSTMRRSTEFSCRRLEFARSFAINPHAICAITSNVPGMRKEHKRTGRCIEDKHKWSEWSGKQLCAGKKTMKWMG